MMRAKASDRAATVARAARWRARRRLVVCAVGLIAVASFWTFRRQTRCSSIHEQALAIARAEQALAARRYVAAEQLAADVLARHPHHADALLIAGEAASRRGDLPAALAYYQQLPDSDDPRIVLGRCAVADIEFRLGAWSKAERDFRAVLRRVPDHRLALSRLAYLLTLEGRGRLAAGYRLRLLRQGAFSLDDLAFLGDTRRLAEIPPELSPADERQADWPIVLGLAALAFDRREFARCQTLVDRVLTLAPKCAEAQILRGELLRTTSPERFADWSEQATPELQGLPEFWLISGAWLQAQGELAPAARAFWEALRRDPEYRAAHDRLAVVLAALGRDDDALPFAERGRRLEELVALVAQARHDAQNVDLLRSCAELCESLGRLWEAYGWSCLALTLDPNCDWAVASCGRLEPRLRAELPQTADEANPALALDLSDLPLAKWPGLAAARRARAATIAKQDSGTPAARHDGADPSIRFDDVAQSVGIDFIYHNGHDTSLGPRMFEFSGGGCAVLDYDGDGYPDLHLTQGCAWPPQPKQTEHLDRLYRNRGGRAFDDITRQALLAEGGFSQGVAVGDFNQDGFADLYIANIGGNRLLANQGDGTFTDVSEAAGVSVEAWTTSCLMADLNGDGLPDLYDVNYCMGADVFERVCMLGGRPSLCAPGVFQPQPDRLWLNLGNGTFADVSGAAGVEMAGGNGLGIVAADFDGSGRLSLFVANDQDANFYFANQAERGAPPAFDEQGVLLGLAFDGRGRAQACMGVAAGDANHDGRLDLFVTNFYRESNTLYLAGEHGFFSDATAVSGLAEASFTRLGFGTQFIDANLDGWEDLVVVNGHIDDRTSEGIPYAMRPQLFVNTGGRFREQSDVAGDYFLQPRLGRALARIDWNRDGREDLVATNLVTPAALLTNATPDAGHFVAVELRGVVSARDAIGARVRVTSGGQNWWRQLTAGDGYQASNERRLVFGLGRQETVDSLAVAWPAGGADTFSHLAVDTCYRIVEGRHEAIAVP